MADAPSGNSSWGAFEIILVCLLVLAILSNIGRGGSSYKPPLASENPSENLSINNNESACGISITNPISYTKVTNTVRLSGLTTGCNWAPKESIALYAQVIDAKGKPLSEYTPVLNTNTDFFNVSFDTSIPLYRQTTGNGYLLLIPANGKPLSYRIPLSLTQK